MLVATRTSQRRVVAVLTVAVLVLSSVAVAAVVSGTGRRAATVVSAAVLPSASPSTTVSTLPPPAVDTSRVRLPRVDEPLGSSVEEPARPTSPPPTMVAEATRTDEVETAQPEQCALRTTSMPLGVELVAVATADGLRLRSVDGRTSWSLPAAEGVDLRKEDVAWEPGGTRVAFSVHRSSPPSSAVILADAASPCWRTVTPVAVGLYDQPAWTADGRLGYRATVGPDVDGPSVVTVDLRDAEAVAKRVPLAVGTGPVWAPDRSGRFAFTDRDGLKLYDTATGAVRLLHRAVDAVAPTWSPDATRVLFTLTSDSTVWWVRVDGGVGGGAARLSPPELFGVTRSSWSRDGTRIAFIATPRIGRPGSDVWVMDADGGRLRPITSTGQATGAVSWSADGSTLAYAEVAPVEGADPAVVVADVATGERRSTGLEGRVVGFVRRAR